MNRGAWMAALAGVVASCSGTKELGVEVALPGAVRPEAAWVEIGAFEGACIDSAQLAGGLPGAGALARLAFDPRLGQAPPLGNLKRGKYAFAAVARNVDCAVLAAGCATLDVGAAEAVKVALDPVAEPAGACGAGAVCQSGKCVPGLDNADPSVGAACSLQLVGAGPFPNPLVERGVYVSAPAVVATDEGFVAAYREHDPTQGQARLTLVPVDSGGGAHPPIQETLDKRCAAVEEKDPVGLATNGRTGIVVVTRRECPQSASGLNLFAIDAAGVVQKRGTLGFGDARSLALSNAHAVAPIAGSSDYALAVVVDGARAQLARIRDVAVSDASDFGGVPPLDTALVATSDKVLALVARGPASGVVPDGGAEGGAGGAGAGGTTLRVNVAAAGTPVNTLPFPAELDGTWASVAAQATRVAVVSDGVGVGRPVALRLFDLARQTSAPLVLGFSPESLGKVGFADVTFRGNHLFLAVEQPGAITLAAYDRATTTPTPLREVALGRDPRIPSIARLRGGRLAIAASDARVAVVWTTAERLDENDVVGGYAVFACR